MKLELKRFDMKQVRCDSVVMYLGSRGSGKTCTVIDTLRHHVDIPIGIVISPTEVANGTFSQIIPRILVYDEYTPALLAKFIERQKQVMQRYNTEIARHGKTDIDPRAFLIMDDALFDNSWTRDPSIRYCFLNGRHLHIFFLLTSQYPLGVPPILRANIDFVFINRNSNRADRERIYEHYAGIFPTFHVFEEVMQACTENYECLVIHKSGRSNKLNECVFWYKSNPTPNFKMCSKDLWEIQALEDQRKLMAEDGGGDGDGDAEEPDFDPRMVYKQRGPAIRVRKV